MNCDETKLNELFDTLEDALVAKMQFHDVRDVGVVMPLMEASRALLMVWRGVEPLMPRRTPA